MRTIHESSKLLVVAETASGMRICGAAISAIGAVILAAGAATQSTAGSIVGVVALAIGAMVAMLPATSTFHFNRSRRQLLVSRRRVWQSRRRREKYPLRDVVAVQVDESRSDEGGSTWRVIVRFVDGHIVPFTSYYTSGRQPKVDVANRLSKFLSLPFGTQSIGGQASPYAIVPQSRRSLVGAGMLLIAFGALFGSIGGVMLSREFHRLTEWQPVQATVLGTRVDVKTDAEGDTYRPVIDYRYSVNNQVYTSSRALPIDESRSGVWAHRVVARYTPGATYTAWYDPVRPSDAYIVRSHSIIAPIFTALGAMAIVAGLAIAFSAGSREYDARRPANR